MSPEPADPNLRRVLAEAVAIAPYDARWPKQFAAERDHLRACLPRELVRRIEHFGSTAVPGLAAKPIVDMLVEVTDLEATRRRIAPILQAKGYDYFWRPTRGDDGPPFYAWFIKRNEAGARTHHIHMVEASFAEHWQRLLFRDWLRTHGEEARAYEALKRQLAAHSQDRVAYAQGKSAFIEEVMARARGVPLPIASIVIDGANVIATAKKSAIARLDLVVGWFAAWRPDLPITVFVDYSTFAVANAEVQAELQRRAALSDSNAVTYVICKPGQPADAPLLQHAADHRALVVSNDRYFDHEALRKNAILLQFTAAGRKFAPQTEATWFRSPGLAVWVPLADLQRRA